MQGVLSAELAILTHFKPVGVVLLVLVGYIVALLALRAGHSDFNSHLTAPPDYTAFAAFLGSLALNLRATQEKPSAR